ncbi:MAG: M1 family metallopeptidase [Bacteroidota bacterium]
MTTARICLALICSLTGLFSNGQRPYFQQQVDYRIEARLNDSLHQIDATATIHYQNQSPDTLHYIWFHVWPNAYKSERTALGEQLLENGDTRFYFSNPEQKGYINRLDFRVNGVAARMEDHPKHLDIIKLILPEPLLPGKSVQIFTPFHVQLPDVFSRSGHGKNGNYQITQWYPKPAVYDREGWHPLPYLDQGEFYSEFGNYQLAITVPEEYLVAATGVLTDSTERVNLLTRGLQGNHGIPKRVANTSSNRSYKTLHYTADSVHDFAWFASPNFLIQYDTCQLNAGSAKEIWHFFTNSFSRVWKNSIPYSKEALRYYSDRIGTYPYPTISVVETAEGPGGGMEYPMLATIDPTSDSNDLRSVIIHEIGHNWFYGALASNEREYPWLDEGLNSYYERKNTGTILKPEETILLSHLYQERRDQPINTSSDRFSILNYAAIAYLKTAQWMELMEKRLGKPAFDRSMQAYFQQWKFKHPSPSDLLTSFQSNSQADLSHYFHLIDKKGPLEPSPRIGWKWQGLPAWLQAKNLYTKNQITAFPAIGFNQPDGIMTGMGVTNLKVPLNDLQWLVIPLYATRSKEFNGIGFINHRWRPEGIWSRIDLGLGFSRFSFNRFTTPNKQTLTLRFMKLSPGIRFTWKETPRSTRNRQLQFSYFHFNETGYRYQRDTLINGSDTTINNYYRTVNETRGLAQIKFSMENNRKLYPYRLEMKVEGHSKFIRPTFTATQFFNYPRSGGLQARIFGGAFLYLGKQSLQQRFRQSRYYLQMSGPSGMDDYTYSDYFIGRSAYEGIASQQIMDRDGAFKIRTDRLASPVGRSDQWLLALNLSSSIPDKINPLSVLPIRVPLHVFADIGVSGSASDPSSRWLYVAGLELPLLQRNVRIFLPLLYSTPFQEYVRSILEPKKRFWQKISFQINVSQWHSRKLVPEIDLW